MNFIKNQSVGTIVTCCTLLLSLVGVILYVVNVTAVGFYNAMNIDSLVLCTILALVAEVAVIALAQLNVGGVVGSVLDIVANALKIVVPVLLTISLMAFVSTRLEGFGFILFCDENIKATMQTPENMTSVATAIAGFVFYGLAMISGIVAAFMGSKKN